MILLALLLATVTAPYAPPTYACNGSTAVFTVNFPYLEADYVVVTSTTAGGAATTLVQTTDYALSVSSTSSTALATLTNPATTCPTGNQLKIFRSTAKTQPYSFRQQTVFSPTLFELAYDRQTMISQELSVGTAASGDISQATVLIPGTTTAVNISSLLAGSPIAAKAFGVNCDGTDESARIQQCATSATQCLLPPSNNCNIGSTTLTVPTGHRLLGHGKQSTTITYTGTGCATSFDNNDGGGAEKIHFNVTNTASTVHNICITNVTGPTLRLSFPEVMVVGASNPPITGAYCVYMHSTTGNSLYYNLFTQLVTLRCDRGVEMLGDVGSGGVNANWLLGYSSNANVTGTYFDGASGDNFVQGHCNASGTTFSQSCSTLGDGTHTLSGNEIHLVSDTGGTWGSVFNLQNHAVNSIVFATNESGGADGLTGDSTNKIFDNQVVGAASSNVFLPSLNLGSGLDGTTGVFNSAFIVAHIVASTAGGGGTVALTAGSATVATFTGARCVCSDTTATNACKVSVAATTATFTGTGTDTLAYFCY